MTQIRNFSKRCVQIDYFITENSTPENCSECKCHSRFDRIFLSAGTDSRGSKSFDNGKLFNENLFTNRWPAAPREERGVNYAGKWNFTPNYNPRSWKRVSSHCCCAINWIISKSRYFRNDGAGVRLIVCSFTRIRVFNRKWKFTKNCFSESPSSSIFSNVIPSNNNTEGCISCNFIINIWFSRLCRLVHSNVDEITILSVSLARHVLKISSNFIVTPSWPVLLCENLQPVFGCWWKNKFHSLLMLFQEGISGFRSFCFELW